MSSAGTARFRELAALVLFEDVGLLADEVDDAAEILLLADGHLDRDGLAAEELVDGLDGPVEARVLAVELVDDEDAGQADAPRSSPRPFPCRPRRRRPPHDEDRGRVHGPQPGLGVPQEIAVARSVEDVDLVVVPFDEAERPS